MVFLRGRISSRKNSQDYFLPDPRAAEILITGGILKISTCEKKERERERERESGYYGSGDAQSPVLAFYCKR